MEPNRTIQQLKSDVERRLEVVSDLLRRLYFWPLRKTPAPAPAGGAVIKAFYYFYPNRRQGSKYWERWQAARPCFAASFPGSSGAERVDVAVAAVLDTLNDLNAAVEAVKADRSPARFTKSPNPFRYDYPALPGAFPDFGWKVGDNILLRYGNGTQVFHVFGVIITGRGRAKLIGARLKNRGHCDPTYLRAYWGVSCPIWLNDSRILGSAELCPQDPAPPTPEQFAKL